MEKENKSLKNKKKSSAFILFLLIFMVLVLYLIYNIGLNFEPVTIIEYEGYAVSGKELVENLLKSDLNAIPYIDAVKIEEDDAIYKKIATYFVGEEKKTKINLDYPIYINQNIALLNMSEDTTLITTSFEEIEGYKNSTLTNGGLYNVNGLDRADYNDYLLLKNSDNIYINSKEIEIKTNVNTYVIPKNSIISFNEEYIAYYFLKDGIFKYRPIIDVDLDSTILIETINYIRNVEKGEMTAEASTEEYTYNEFLTNLNLIRKPIINKVEENEEENIQEENQIQVEEPSIDNNEPTNTDNTDQEIEPPKVVWQKPNVTVTNFETSVYTASTVLSIYDPSGVIKTAITFEIYKNGKVYMRNQAVSSGNLRLGVLEPNTEYEIRGIYRYSDEEGKTIETQFISQEIKTKSIDELKPLKLSFKNGNIYSNKIEIADLKIESDLNEVSETIIGVETAEIKINDKTYSLRTSELRKLLNGQAIVCESQENLKSNSEVSFEIYMYDVANNLVKLENNSGKANTCMKKPEMIIELTNNKMGIDISLKTRLKNPDNVEIKNMKYIIYSVNNEIIDQGVVTSDIIKPKNIELAKYYIIKVYGDYDLKNYKGEVTDNLLGETSFTTSKIESFGELYVDLDIETENINNDSTVINFNINTTTNKTNIELVKMLKQAAVVIYSKNEVIQRNYLNVSDFNTFINLGTVNLPIDRLDSNTNYTIKIEAMASLGNAKREFNAIINGPKTFTTLKQETQINIKNLIVLSDMIDFDINIYDKDEATRTSKVILEVISTRDEVIQRNEISTSKTANEYTRIQIPNLLNNEKYYLSITTDRYSIRQEESTIKQKSFEFNGDEKRITNEKRNNKNVGVIWTNDVGGEISLESLEKRPSENNKNLVDVESNVNWYSECFNTNRGYLKEYDSANNILKLGVGQSTSQIYVYDLYTTLPNYNGEELEVYFKYKKNNNNLKIYLQNGTDFANNKVLEITGENTVIDENGWSVFDSKDISNIISTFQYFGVLLEGNVGNYVEIKDLYVKIKENEEEKENTEEDVVEDEDNNYKFKFTSKFKLNLNLYDDLENSIINEKYYIRLKNITDNTIIDNPYSDYIQKAANDNGENINSIEDSMVNLDLEQNKKYEIMLVLKHNNVEGREYILSQIEVDATLNEIKNISNISEYLKIQPNGSYVFSNNINLGSGDYKFGNENLYFNGTLDFNGKTLKRQIALKEDTNYKYYLFYGLSEQAQIKNLYFDFSINLINEEGRTDIAMPSENSGLVYENKGNISNIIVNLASSTNSPNEKFAIIGYHNSGTLENFAIYLKANFYLGGTGALGFVNCVGGTIKNGYMTPYPNTSYTIKPIDCYDEMINIGGLVSSATNNSKINNIYSLVTISNTDEDASSFSKKFTAGNILAELTDSTAKNIYSVGIGNITLNNSEGGTRGPTICYQYDVEDKNNVQNSYFFYDENFNNNEYNTKVNVAALSNEEFQANLLNSEDSDKKFDVNSTVKEYFPTLKMSEVMPAQLRIPMKKATETDADVLLVNTLTDGDLEKIVEFTIFNPRESKIDKIEIEGLEVDEYRIHSNEYCNPNNPFEKCKGHDQEGYCLDENGNRIKVEDEGYTQNYLSGQTTKLIAKIRIPSQEKLDIKGFDSRRYASSYCLKSIRAKGYAEKVYIKDDRTEIIRNEIKLIYYYQITNIQKWKRINEYPDENYRLLTDLDLANTAYTDYCVTSTFSGILNGEYETGKMVLIKDIGRDGIETKIPLFYKLDNAKMCNIMIDGFAQKIENKNINENAFIGGLIGVTTKGTVIDNIHIKNAKIVTKAEKNNADNFYIGGLVANIDGTTIKNSSVSYKNDGLANITDVNENRLSTARVGGLVGYAKESTITNSFVKNVFINVNLGTSDGIGGIVGRFTGEVIGCYSTGQIKTNAQDAGGIFGRTLETKKYVDRAWVKEPNICNNCYSSVNIKTDNVNLGGVGGFASQTVISEITNNISIGNLYTSMGGSNTNSNRVIGNISSTIYVNYGYKSQLINGFKISPQDKNYNRGAKYVVAKENMMQNYNNMFNEDFYQVKDLEKEFLPRLKYNNTETTLPNQENLEKLPENPTLEIISAKETDGKIKIEIKDENEPHVETTNINIEISNFKDLTIEKREYNGSTKIHTLYVTGQPIYYFDSYEIARIMYMYNNGEEYNSEIAVKVDYLQYKEISSAEEWAREFCPEYTKYNYHKTEDDGKPEFLSGQNYKITGDIKLSDIQNLNGEALTIPTKLEIGRLIGIEENRPTISDFSITTKGANTGLFSSITKELKDINFKDIYIKNTSGNYTGIIIKCTAQQIANMDFENITIEAASSYSGIIADSTCNNIANIKLENIKCTGSSYVAGFIARTKPGTIDNITANNIDISATSSYSGGIFGYMYAQTSSYGSQIKNLTVTNSKIISKSNYVGGIIGYGTIRSNAKSENNLVQGGSSYIGGVLGSQFNAISGSDFYIKDVTVKRTSSGSHLGGATGYNSNTLTKIYINGINITANSGNYVGAISGHGSAINNSAVEGYVKEDGTAYNIVNAANCTYVGGITGYTGSTINTVHIKNVDITGNQYVGGIVGRIISGSVINTFSQDCTVTGNTNVGGILGGYTTDSVQRNYTVLNIYNTYNNAKITAKNNTAGGIVGYLDNKRTNNQAYRMYIYRNYVAGSEISAPTNKGSLIGRVVNPLYYLNNNTKYYYSNLTVSNIDENYPVGNIDNIIETYTIVDLETQEEQTVTRVVPSEETISRLFNSVFYKYDIENGQKVLEKSSLESLKLESTYKNTLLFGNNNSNYNYSTSIINTMFPLLKNSVNKIVTYLDGTTKLFNQTGILLPEEKQGEENQVQSLMSLYMRNILPDYDVYVSDVNKINIEFSEITPNTYFQYEYNENISEKITLDKRVYTFEYDFITSFKIIVGNNDGQKQETITPNNIAKRVSIINENYYYLADSSLKVNLETLEGDFINLFNNKALTTDGYIYYIENNKKNNTKTEGLTLLSTSIPLTESIYSGNIIETYYNFSRIVSQETENISEYQMFIKNNRLFVLDGTLDIYSDSIIIDAYNNKEYQTVLGTDGIIYDLKEKINYPEDFTNEKILQMTNNINSDTNTILIMYEGGRIYAFNYITGSVLFDTNQKETNLLQNVATMVTSMFSLNRNALYEPTEQDYQDAIELQQKLTDTPIENVVTEISEGTINSNIQNIEADNETQNVTNKNETGNDITNNVNTGNSIDKNTTSKDNPNINSEGNNNESASSSSSKNNAESYVTVYDSDSNTYLVYKTSTLLNESRSEEKVISETEKINLDPALKEFYETANGSKTSDNTKGIYLIIISIVTVGVILIIMYKKKNYA